MATDPKKRQKKLQRRTAKRKEKKHHLIREQNAGLAERLSAAAKFPVLHCWMGESLWEEGIGWVVLSRELPNGSAAVVSFLADPYCLGVKDVFAEVMTRPAYDAKYLHKMHTEMPSRSVPPAEARKFLEDVVAYARGLGLSPHPDYPRAMLLFGSVDSAESDAEFEFGKDGQPFFVGGPNDTPERCRRILATLNNTCGPGKFHYLIPLGGPEFGKALPDAHGSGDMTLIGPDEEEFVDDTEGFDDEEG